MSIESFRQDLNQALKNSEALKASVLRFLLAAFKNREISLRAQGLAITEVDLLEVIGQQVKQRRESIEAYSKAGRADLASKEKQELEILQAYLPPPLSEAAIKELVGQAITAVGASGTKDIGRVMSEVMPLVKGKADGQAVKSLVYEMLSACS